MSINEIIVFLMAVFMALGALDRIFGGKFGLGEQFVAGIESMGALALAMIGIICLAPVLANLLRPVLVPVYRALGADPAMFAGSVLACDMGGASLAYELAQTTEAAQFGGLIVGSMLGPTIVFTIPVAMGVLPQEEMPYLAKGVLAGILTVPLGCFAGGLVAGFPVFMIVRNLVPIVIFALLIGLGLWKWENAMIRGFAVFGKLVVALITVGLAAAIFQKLTGIIVIAGMEPIEAGFATVGEIAIVLAGAFPLIFVLTKLLRKPLLALGRGLKINETAAAGLVASLANSIPMFGMMKDMDSRGKLVNVAFAVSAAFVFGDHLGFVAGFDGRMLLPVIVGKLTGGISAVLLAMLLSREEQR